MSLKQWLPFLVDELGRSLDVENNVVVTRSIPDPIDETPEGWEDNVIQYSRNKDFKATIVSYITNLTFYFQGARILREYYYRIGIEAVLFFVWLKLDQSFGANLEHKDWYKGQPDFSTFKDGYDGVQINISEGGFFKELQANKTTPYQYAYKDDPDTCSLLLDGTYIEQETTWLITDGDGLSPNNGQHSLQLEVITNESINSVDTATQKRRHFTNNADLVGNTQYFHKTGSAPEVLNIKLRSFVTPSLATGISPNITAGSLLLIRAFDDTGVVTDAYPLDAWGNTGSIIGFYNVGHLIDIDVSITVPANRRLFMCMFLTLATVIASGSTADEVVYWDYQISEKNIFKMNYNYLFKETIIDAFRAYSLGNKFFRSVSNNRSGLVSDLLGNDYNLLCTSGDAIRGIKDAYFKSTPINFYKSIDAVKCIGLKVEKNQGRIESRYDFFTNTEISNLGPAKIPATGFVTPANEYIYSLIEYGFPDTDTRSINGKYSFLVPSTMKAPVLNSDNVYDCRSLFKADPFVIELIRINTYGKTTTDNNSDNDPFFVDGEKVYPDRTGTVQITQLLDGIAQVKLIGSIGLSLRTGVRFKILSGYNMMSFLVDSSVEISGDTVILVTALVNDETIVTTVEFMHYKLRRKPYVSITGIPSQETIFNIELLNATCLKNHWRWLRSGWEHMDNKYVTFQTTSKNEMVVTEDSNGNIVQDNDDILIGSMGDRVFIPHYLIFEVGSPSNLKALMDANDTGYFGFQADETNYQGYVEDIKSNDTTLETQDYKLLATPNNDFTNRILSS